MEVVDLTRGRRAVGLLPAGTLLGRYEVIRLLSVGGMAEIYLARTEGVGRFEKRVVLKRMLPHFAIQSDYVRMFLAEARLAAKLEHPNIVSVYDIGEETGNYHYAMEYVRGGDLRDLLRATARSGELVPLGVAIGIALGVCAGLDHAHNATDADGRSLEVVHRDVSLSNVLVSFDGAVKVTDFGVAKMDEADRRTRTGTLKGKVAYMSPEQCRGLALDRRSDVFAIGIILYELVTCRRLFGGGGELVTLQRIVREDAPPPSRNRPGCPAALDEIMARALARDRNQRYQTARELGRDLEALARTERFATSPSEIAGFVTQMIGLPSVQSSVRLATETNAFDAESKDEEDAIISVEIVPYESAPVAAAPDVKPAPRPVTVHAGAQRWDRLLRYGAVAMIGVALATIFFTTRGGSSPPPPRAAVGSFEPPPAEMRPRPGAATGEPARAAVEVRALAPGADDDVAPIDAAAAPAHEVAGTRDESRERAAVHRTRRDSEPSRRPAATSRRERLPRIIVEGGEDASVGSDDVIADPFDPAPPPTVSPPPDARPPPPPSSESRPPPAASRPPPLPPTLAPPSASPAPQPPTGSLDAVASLSRVDVQGPLQDSVLRRALERVMPSVRACYRAAASRARTTPRLELRVGFEIDDARAARNVRVGGAPLPGLSSCVADAIGRARTRVAPDVGNALVDLVIVFTPTRR